MTERPDGTTTERIERAMVILQEIFKPHPRTENLQISFNRFEASSLNIEVVHWWGSTDWPEYVAGFQKLMLEVKRRFDEEKIAFAFPTQTVYLRQDSEWKVASEGSAGKVG